MKTIYQETIEREEIDTFPIFSYEGDIQVIDDPKSVEEAVSYLAAHGRLGFDTETRPSFRKGESHSVSLLQLAVPERVYLFRLNKCGFPLSLRRLMEEEGIMKIGVGIRDDIRALEKLGSFKPASFVDLQEYVKKFGIEEKAFSKLMAIIFRVRISKRQRTSNWEVPVLAPSQLKYAATDAWGALRMYGELTDQYRQEEARGTVK